MLTTEHSKAILDAVDQLFDAQIAFTQDLVRHPSLRGDEATAQDFMFEAMRKRNLDMDRWKIDIDALCNHPGFGPVTVSYENAYNVVGTYRPKTQRGRSLILNGHIDVVPTGPRGMWTRSPWEPHIENGWLYGRGSADMKAGLAANLFAFDAVLAAGFKPCAPIYFQSVVEEECTGNGALACLERGYKADSVIIPEPEENMLVRANTGVLWFKVRVTGRPAHTREMATGFNAIDTAYSLITSLRELEADWNAEHLQHPHFEHLDHPINFNIGKIEGGDWPSTVPPWCEFEVRVAMYPGMTARQGKVLIEACIGAAAKKHPGLSNSPPEVSWTGFFAEGYVLPEGTDAEKTLRICHQKTFGEDLQTFTTPGYLDARVYMIYGNMPTLVYGPVSKDIHGFDERVELDSLRRITKTIALYIAEWCGIEKAEN